MVGMLQKLVKNIGLLKTVFNVLVFVSSTFAMECQL